MEEKINISSLSELFSKKYSISKEEAEKFINTFLQIVEEKLLIDKYVKIKGWGIFRLIKIEKGEEQQIEQFEISFIPDDELKNIINKPFAHFESVILNENVHFDDECEEKGACDAPKEAPDVMEEIKPDIVPNDARINDEKILNDALQEDKGDESIISPLENDNTESEKEGMVSTEAEMPLKEESTSDNYENAQSSSVNLVSNEEECTQSNTDNRTDCQENKSNEHKNNKIWFIASILLVLLLCALIAYLLISQNMQKKHILPQKQDISMPIEQSVPTLTQTIDTLAQDSIASRDSIKNEVKVHETLQTPMNSENISPEDTLLEINGTKCDYQVKSGESLAKISYKFYGSRKLWIYIVEHNKEQLKNPDLVTPGTIIKIPNLVKKNAIS